jgi:putative flippase GtrA
LLDKIKSLYVKYRELVNYGFFGVLTTLVNFAVYVIATDVFLLSYVVSNVIAWVIAVTFAFTVNKLWVFRSAGGGVKGVREFSSFFAARVLTWLLESGIILLFAEKLGYNDKIVKGAATVLVIILNYVLSKVIVFRRR